MVYRDCVGVCQKLQVYRASMRHHTYYFSPGKHRSGFFCILLLVFLSGVRGLPVHARLQRAKDMYFIFHPAFRPADHNEQYVNDLMRKNLEGINHHEFPALVAAMEDEPLYQQVLAKFQEMEQPTSTAASSRDRSRSRGQVRVAVIGKAAVPAKARPKSAEPEPKAKPKARPQAAAPPEIHSQTPTEPSSEVRDPRFTARSYSPRSTVVRSGPRFADPIFDSDPTSSSEDSWRTDTMEWVKRDCWACPCGSMNLRFNLFCFCGLRRPLREDWNWRPQDNDWLCEWCGNYNFSWRPWCVWSDCPTGDWECVCVAM